MTIEAKLRQTKKEFITNLVGYYEFTDLEDGKWHLRVNAKGYKPINMKVGTSADGTFNQDFALEPKGNQKEKKGKKE